MELEDFALPYEDRAAERYELTVVKARELKFENEWTQRALERINEFKPREYPLLKEEKARLLLDPEVDSVWDAQPGDGLVRPTKTPVLPPVPDPEEDTTQEPVEPETGESDPAGDGEKEGTE